jgi:phosphoglucomutase
MSDSVLTVNKVETKPFKDQKAGTSGLRKSTKQFQEPNYVENFIQSFFNALNEDLDAANIKEPITLMLGGDGRFFVRECIAKILQLSGANPRIGRVIVAQNGIMSTPALSCCIRKYKAFAGVILTASHNPGGPNADFGIKFNSLNGGPALQYFTDKIFEMSKSIKEYSLCSDLVCDVSNVGEINFKIADNRQFTVKVIDSVQDYLEMMQNIFDFNALKTFFKSGVKITVNSLNGGKNHLN